MKELLDQDSDPPLKMPEVKLITKLGYEETLSELCKSARVSVCYVVSSALQRMLGRTCGNQTESFYELRVHVDAV